MPEFLTFVLMQLAQLFIAALAFAIILAPIWVPMLIAGKLFTKFASRKS